jgi:hypothetical protein
MSVHVTPERDMKIALKQYSEINDLGPKGWRAESAALEKKALRERKGVGRRRPRLQVAPKNQRCLAPLKGVRSRGER